MLANIAGSTTLTPLIYYKYLAVQKWNWSGWASD